ncbi:peptide-methionine (R)-S-oxide reductase MsrB (plasmid) [Rhizobium sp. TRM96647]|uniref:peptide-methionine (R)-S-oxide reductase MsrB n=1 Tax=unclassified Rhizobium TaxID=2613769 RepID=UPI0021E83B1E|nr:MULTISPECIES: peptide-methionine (R)-S-oxide reductase MsrB [unclassified Rhizobium]MCV3735670.1 peptide-methionine (R)-S-oxide reductase MsrB [Rhizobium sp. TRM96647]MCV3757567.1 peptide-methionine (R)-S-oxide reductase MsrB [Rhizobium sp. TRM96650]
MSDNAKLKVFKTDEEWRQILTPEQYRITRQHGTERAFSSPDFDSSKSGTYRCICCDRPLYSSEAKFNSGTGWPSFTQPIAPDAVTNHRDLSYGMNRVEIRCADCDAHLGHVFPDGPPPAGLRYCMNGVALSFEEQ